MSGIKPQSAISLLSIAMPGVPKFLCMILNYQMNKFFKSLWINSRDEEVLIDHENLDGSRSVLT